MVGIILNAEFYDRSLAPENEIKKNKYFYTIYKEEEDHEFITIEALLIYNGYKFKNIQKYHNNIVSMFGLDMVINKTLKTLEQ